MVGKIKIIFTPQVIDFLDNLVQILYKEEYFGFIESAEDYVIKIYYVIPDIIKLGIHKKTLQSLKYLGSNYIFYKSNKRTIWYIFFEKKNHNYLITSILNNHCEEAKDL
ncbi:hypothetical protein [Flavobacterium seoulense]|uniref:Plasmid stabilization protein n=1 Tax=Flavobacterium seoulense TaxID=1492738 RepID=A0A066WKB1_9FLAO|nr:hypothetical protein [Flavobacterium seoulense]KDN54432.1 hypothetical protein FEM21_23940 [Flavobacterium seoulense]